MFLSSKRHPAESVADTTSQKAAIVPFFFFFGSAGSDRHFSHLCTTHTDTVWIHLYGNSMSLKTSPE